MADDSHEMSRLTSSEKCKRNRTKFAWCFKGLTCQFSFGTPLVLPVNIFFKGGPTPTTGINTGSDSSTPVSTGNVNSKTVSTFIPTTSISSTQTSPITTMPSGYARTVIIIEKQTSPGQDLFIRGGLSHKSHAGI